MFGCSTKPVGLAVNTVIDEVSSYPLSFPTLGFVTKRVALTVRAAITKPSAATQEIR